ncbi:cysteate synthase [Streptomyces sp. NPDC005322]|uniref:cysteate synthase n=1 Tax=Streptomyces sp. NPDC005322 TaxID=3157032 RepID=UPI0033B108F3
MNSPGIAPAHYSLVCSICGDSRPDDGVTLDCSEPHQAGLLLTEYKSTAFTPTSEYSGIYRYRNWLPIRRTFPASGSTVVYRSEALGALLGFRNLWIAYNGYWPERRARLETGTFKELEAYTVLSRLPAGAPVLVLASAGNTAAAFATLCSQYRVPVVIVVPMGMMGNLKFRTPLSPCVKIVAVAQGDYYDAISLADALSKFPGFIPEGGVRNVARRDGLGTVMQSAFDKMGEMPDYYFQAIGSGAGAIAVHEVAVRLRKSSGGTLPLPRLMLSQNAPFTPVFRAWRSGRRVFAESDETIDRQCIAEVCAQELTNRRPPYIQRGGLFDVLTQSAGDVHTVGNDALQAARRLFLETEGIDIEPASGVALASLCSAVADRKVSLSASVLLNITGGGRARLAEEHGLVQAAPARIVPTGLHKSSESLIDLVHGLDLGRMQEEALQHA